MWKGLCIVPSGRSALILSHVTLTNVAHRSNLYTVSAVPNLRALHADTLCYVQATGPFWLDRPSHTFYFILSHPGYLLLPGQYLRLRNRNHAT